MRELVVETTDPTPPYEQLRRQLAALIRDGSLARGERLPPLRQLAGDLGLAVGTVARAYRELEAAGLIVSRRGGGTTVATLPLRATPPSGALLRAAEAYVEEGRRLGVDRAELVETLGTVLDQRRWA